MSIIYQVTNQYSISKYMPPGLILFSLFNLSSELLVISFFFVANLYKVGGVVRGYMRGWI